MVGALRISRVSLAGVLSMLIAFPAAFGVPAPAPVRASDTPPPVSVTIAGSLQDELGCAGDWQPECAATHLTHNAEDDVWQGVWTLPAGSYEYKAALNDSWDENYGAGAQRDGGNIALNLAAATEVKFYYDHDSHWVTDGHNSRIVTAPGSYQSELGCSGDWDPGCLRSWLQDADGNGTYSFSTTALPAGEYETKAAINEAWDENYGAGGEPNGPNIAFSVPSAGSTVTFSFVSATNVLSISVVPDGEEPPDGASHDNDIWWADLGHDSRDTLYRSPSGPVVAGTSVNLRLRAASGDLTAARVRVWDDRNDTQSILPMTLVADDGEHEWWQATVSSSQPTIFWYRFIAIDGTATAYYEDDAARTGGRGETFGGSPDYSWQLTVYDPAFETPDWVKNAVIYQIFPDRFRNGDAANDPDQPEFFYEETPTVWRSYGSDWNTPICDPRDAAGDCPGVYSQNFYGGDLAGITQRLGYLSDLGITALYLNPIFDSPSNHKYDTTDFTQIDPAFGSQADFETLATEANALGIRLILDGVFNHSSSDSLYFDRYERYASVGACESATSPYRDWYYFSAVAPGTGPCVGDDGTAGGADYESWFGFDSLPKLNAGHAEVRDFFYAGGANAVGPYWMTWADGWRLDVAGDVDPGLTNDPANDYWEGFRAAVRAANPEAYIVGEEWGVATAWTLGAEWDATMNYQLSSALLSFFRDTPFVDNDHNSGSSAGVLNPISASQLAERILNLQERYPPEAFQALMNLLGSHDTNRPLFMLDHNASQNDRSLYENPSYDWSDAISRLRGVALLQATLPGAPTVYYGDEVGLVAPPTYDGATWQDDPYNRIPYPWLDESGTPYYAHLQSEEGQAQLLDPYTLLLNTRNSHPALRTGSLDVLLADDAAMTFAFGRKMADHSDAAVVVVNRSDTDQPVALDVAGYLPVGAQFTDVLNGDGSHTVGAAGELTLNVPARHGALLVLSSPMAAAPAAVDDLAVTGQRSQELDLAWTAVSGADSYDVYRSLVSGGGYTFVATTPATDYTDVGLGNASTYHYVVVSRDDTTLLSSGYSNEASGTPGHDLTDRDTSWFNLQWPPQITHTVSATNRTENIYGQIWIQGATGPDGPAEGIRAQVGFGPDGSTPGESWTWAEMSFNAASGNNDEYVGSLLPDEVGEFDYTTRYSADGGLTWHLALEGPNGGSPVGNLTVLAADDTTAPSAPTLSLDGVSASSISLSWTASTDDVAVHAYEVIRDGERVGRVGASATTYTDESVTTGTTYTYFVRAVDTSFNRSANSNEVMATAENRLVQVTFTVGVPEYTPADAVVYVTGSISQLGPWNPGAYPMTRNSDGTWSRTFEIADGTTFEWKYTRGNWEKVEWWGEIVSLANRGPITVDYGTDGTMVIDNTATDWGTGPDSDKAVRDWRDPLVTGHDPADAATDVATDTTIVVDWSKPMASSSSFSVTGPDGTVAGTFSLNEDATSVTFTPDSPLAQATTYEVSVTGQTSAGGDAQQVPVNFSFTTEAAPEPVLESITVTPANPRLRPAQQQQFTATGLYSDGSQANLTAEADWASSNSRTLSINPAGLARAMRPGTAVITATVGDISGQTTVTVAAGR
ncbi:alpha-amylase family glycosyl hydrolase [soil metagenome]